MNATSTTPNTSTSASTGTGASGSGDWLDGADGGISRPETRPTPVGRGDEHPDTRGSYGSTGHHYDAGPVVAVGAVGAPWMHSGRGWHAAAAGDAVGAAPRAPVSWWSDASVALARLLALPAFVASAVTAVVVLHRCGALDDSRRPPLPTVLAEVVGLALVQLTAAVLALWAAACASQRAGAAALALLAGAIDVATGSRRRREQAAAARATPVVVATVHVVRVTTTASTANTASPAEGGPASRQGRRPVALPPARLALLCGPTRTGEE